MRHLRFPSSGNQNLRPNSESLLGPSPLLRNPFPRIPGPRFAPFTAGRPVQQWPSFHNNARFASAPRPPVQHSFSAQPRPRLQRRSKPVIFPSSIRGASCDNNQRNVPLISNMPASSKDLQKNIVPVLHEKKVKNSNDGEVETHKNNDANPISIIPINSSASEVESEVQLNAQESNKSSVEPNVTEKTSSSGKCLATNQLEPSKEHPEPPSCQLPAQSPRKIKLKRNSTNHSGKPKSRCKVRDHKPIPWPIGIKIKKEPTEELQVQKTSEAGASISTVRNCSNTLKDVPIKIKQEFPSSNQSVCTTEVITSKSSNKRKIELIRPSFSGLKTIKKEKLDEPSSDTSCEILSSPFNDLTCGSETSSNLEPTYKFSKKINIDSTIVPSITSANSNTNSINTNATKSVSTTTASSLSISMTTLPVSVYSSEVSTQPQCEESQATEPTASFCIMSPPQLMCAEGTSQGPEENILFTQSDSYLDMIYSDLSQCVELRLANFFPLLSSAQIIKVFGFCGKVLSWEDCDVAEQGKANESLVCLRGSFAAGLAVEVLNGASVGGTKLSVAPHTEAAATALQALPPEVVHSDVSVQCLQSIQAFLLSEGLPDFLPSPAYSHLHPGDAAQSSRSGEVPPPGCAGGAPTSSSDTFGAQTANLESALTPTQPTVAPAANAKKPTLPVCEQSGAANSSLESGSNDGAEVTVSDISGLNVPVSVSLTASDTAVSYSMETGAVPATISTAPSMSVTSDADNATVINAPDQHAPSGSSEASVLNDTTSGVASVCKKRRKIKSSLRSSKRSKPSGNDGLEPYLALPTATSTQTENTRRKPGSVAKGRPHQRKSITPQSTSLLAQTSQENCNDQVSVPSLAYKNISPLTEPDEYVTAANPAISLGSDVLEIPRNCGKTIISSGNQESGGTESRVASEEKLLESFTVFPSTSQSSSVRTSVQHNISSVQIKSLDNPETTNIRQIGVIESESNQATVESVATDGSESTQEINSDAQGKSFASKTSNGGAMINNVRVSVKQEKDELTACTQVVTTNSGNVNTAALKSSGNLTKSAGRKKSQRTAAKITKKLTKNQKPTQASMKPLQEIDVKPDVRQLEKNLQCSLKKMNDSQAKQKVTEKEEVPISEVGQNSDGVRIKTEPVDACEEESCLPGFDFGSTFGEDRKPVMSSESTADDAAQLVDSFRDQISAVLPSPVKTADDACVKAECESEPQVPEHDVDVSHSDSFQEDDYIFDDGLTIAPPLSTDTTASPSNDLVCTTSTSAAVLTESAVETTTQETTTKVTTEPTDRPTRDLTGVTGASSGATSVPDLPRQSTSPALAVPPSLDVHINLLKFKKLPCRIIRCRQQSCPRFHDETDYIRDYRKYKGVKCKKVFAHFQHRWREPRYCKRGSRCTFAHNQLEYLFHPSNYKRFACSSLGLPLGSCLFKENCAFRHTHKEITREEVKKQQDLWEQREKKDLTRPTAGDARQITSPSIPDTEPRRSDDPSDARHELSEPSPRVTDDQISSPVRHSSEAGLRVSDQVSDASLCASLTEQPREAGEGRLADASEAGSRKSVNSSLLFQAENPVFNVSSADFYSGDHARVAQPEHPSRSAAFKVAPSMLPTSGLAAPDSLYSADRHVVHSGERRSSGDRSLSSDVDDRVQSIGSRPPSDIDLRNITDNQRHSVGDRRKSIDDQTYSVDGLRHSVDHKNRSIDVPRHSTGTRLSHPATGNRECSAAGQRNSSINQVDRSSCTPQSAENISGPHVFGIVPFGSSVKIERLSPERESFSLKEEVQRDYATYKKNLVTLDECKEITPLERQVQASYPTIPSLESALVGLKVVENLKMLSDSHVDFGFVGSVLPIIHRKASELLRKGENPLSVFNDSDNITLLSLLLQKMPRLETLLGSSGPIAKLKQALLDIVAEVDNSTDVQRDDFLGLDIKALARSTVGFSAQQIKTFIEHVLICDGQSSPSVQQIHIVGMAVAAKHFKMSQGSSNRKASVGAERSLVPQSRSETWPLLSRAPNRLRLSPSSEQTINLRPSHDEPSVDRGSSAVADKLKGLLPPPPVKPCRHGLPPLAAKPFDRLHDQRKVASVTPSVVLQAAAQPSNLEGEPPSDESSRRFSRTSTQRLALSTNIGDSSRVDIGRGCSQRDENTNVSFSRQTNDFDGLANRSSYGDSFPDHLSERIDNRGTNLNAESHAHRRSPPGTNYRSESASSARYSDESLDRRATGRNRSENLCAVNTKRDVDLRCLAPDTVDAFNIRIPDAFGPRSPSTADIDSPIDQDTDQDMRKPHNVRAPYSHSARQSSSVPDPELRPRSRDTTRRDDRDACRSSDFRENCGVAQNASKKQVFVWSSSSYLKNRSHEDLCEELEDEYKPFTAADVGLRSHEYKCESSVNVEAPQSPSPDFGEDVKIKCSDIPLKPIPSRKGGGDRLSWSKDSWRSEPLYVGASSNVPDDKPRAHVPVYKLLEHCPPPALPPRLASVPGPPVLRSELQQPPSAVRSVGIEIPTDTSVTFQSNCKSLNPTSFPSASRGENSSPVARPYMSNLSHPPPAVCPGNGRVSGAQISSSQTTLRPIPPAYPAAFPALHGRNSVSPVLQPVKIEKSDEMSSRTHSSHGGPIKESWPVSRALASPWSTANSEKINSYEKVSRYPENEGTKSSQVQSNLTNASPTHSGVHGYRGSPNPSGVGIVAETQASFPFQPNALVEKISLCPEKVDVFRPPPPFVALSKSSPTKFGVVGLETKDESSNAGSARIGVTELGTPCAIPAHQSSSPGIIESAQHAIMAIRNVLEYSKATAGTPLVGPATDTPLEQSVKPNINAHLSSATETSRNASQNRWFVANRGLAGDAFVPNRSCISAPPITSHDQTSCNLPKNDSLACNTSKLLCNTDSNITSGSPSPTAMICSPALSSVPNDRVDSFMIPEAPVKQSPSSPEKSSPLKLFNTPDMVKLQHSVPRKEWKPPERTATPPPSPWQSLSVRCDSLSMPSPVAGSSGYQSKNETHIYQFLQKQVSLMRPNTEPPITKEPVSKDLSILSKVPYSISKKPSSILKQPSPVIEMSSSTTKSSLLASEEPSAFETSANESSIGGEESRKSSTMNESSEFKFNFPGLNPSNMFPDAPQFTIKRNEPTSCSSDQLSSNDTKVGVPVTTEPAASDALVFVKAGKPEPDAPGQCLEVADDDAPYSPASKYSESDDDKLEVAADEADPDSSPEDSAGENQHSPLNPKDDEISLEFEDMVELLRNFTSLDAEEQIAFSKYLRSLKVRDPETIERLYSRAKMND